MADFTDEYRDLQHARNTQAEFMQAAQDECAAIRRNTEAYRRRTEREMNEDSRN